MKSYIYIDKAEFFAFHGVLPQENVVGNTFFVDLVVEADVLKATESDKIEDTLNYASIFEILKQEMKIPSRLLEHVGGRIICSLRKKFPVIEVIDIRITKKNPPILGQMEGVGIRLIDKK